MSPTYCTERSMHTYTHVQTQVRSQPRPDIMRGIYTQKRNRWQTKSNNQGTTPAVEFVSVMAGLNAVPRSIDQNVDLQRRSFSCLWRFLVSKPWILLNYAKSLRSSRRRSRQPVSNRFLQNTSRPTLGLQDDKKGAGLRSSLWLLVLPRTGRAAIGLYRVPWDHSRVSK